MALDLNKYAAKQSTSTQPIDINRYKVADSAPTLDQLIGVSNAVNVPEEENKYITDAKKRATQAKDSVLGKQKYPGQAVMGVTGALGNYAGDVISNVLNPYLTKVIDTISDNETVQKIATSKAGSAGIDIANKGVSKVGEFAGYMKENYPGTSQFANDAFGTSQLLPVGAASKEGSLIAKDTISTVNRALTPSESAIQAKVVSMFEKGIKPTVKKPAVVEKFNNDIVSAVRKIKENAPSLNIEDATGEIVSRVPQSIDEFAQAVDQTKKVVFEQYDNLAKQAGETGVVVKTNAITDALEGVISSKALQLSSPEVIKYAETWTERLKNFGDIDAQTAQEVVKTMNNNLKSFYKNPTYDAASKVVVDAGIANNLRKALDDAITGATGSSYQELKSAYGALRSIEDDVVRAAMRDARKNAKGLLDYTDMFTSGQMLTGILSLNPAMFTKGAIERGFKEYIKFLNDPNRVIKGMFDVVDRNKTPFVPESKTINYLNKNGGVGMSIKSTVTPESVAKIADKADMKVLAEVIDDYDNAILDPDVNRTLDAMGLGKATREERIRFAKDVFDEQSGVERQVVGKTENN